MEGIRLLLLLINLEKRLKKVFFFTWDFVEQSQRRNECACLIQNNFSKCVGLRHFFSRFIRLASSAA
jgi:hypothetical protein